MQPESPPISHLRPPIGSLVCSNTLPFLLFLIIIVLIFMVFHLFWSRLQKNQNAQIKLHFMNNVFPVTWTGSRTSFLRVQLVLDALFTKGEDPLKNLWESENWQWNGPESASEGTCAHMTRVWRVYACVEGRAVHPGLVRLECMFIQL